MYLSKCIDAMCVKDTAAEDREITIRTSDRELYNGAINDVPKDLLSQNWDVLEFHPDRTRRRLSDYEGIPDYNLPYIIVVF